MHAYIYPPDLQFPHTGVLQLLLYYVVYGRITPTHAMHVPHCRPLLDRSSRSFPGRTVCVLTQDNVLVLGLLFFYFLFGWLTGQPSRCQSTSSPPIDIPPWKRKNLYLRIQTQRSKELIFYGTEEVQLFFCTFISNLIFLFMKNMYFSIFHRYHLDNNLNYLYIVELILCIFNLRRKYFLCLKMYNAVNFFKIFIIYFI